MEKSIIYEKTLYVLKQSPRAWFDRFYKIMMRFGYKQSRADHIVFVKHGNDKITILYVDDIVMTRNNDVKAKLANEFEIKDLAP